MSVPKEVRDAEERARAGEISRQRASVIRKKHGVKVPMGRPPTPAAQMTLNARGCVEVRVLLPAPIEEELDALVIKRNLGRSVLAGAACMTGFDEMDLNPPAEHVAPSGTRRAHDSGVRVELHPMALARIEHYAAERGVHRIVVVAMAVVRGVEAMGRPNMKEFVDAIGYAAALYLPPTANYTIRTDPRLGTVDIDIVGAEDVSAFEAWIADNTPLVVLVTVRKIDRDAAHDR